MSDTLVKTLGLTSEKELDDGFSSSTFVNLILPCSGQPLPPVLSIHILSGWLTSTLNGDINARIRFDSEKAEDYSWRAVDLQGMYIPLRADLLRKLKSHRHLLVQVNIKDAPEQYADFDIAGLDDSLLHAHCSPTL